MYFATLQINVCPLYSFGLRSAIRFLRDMGDEKGFAVNGKVLSQEGTHDNVPFVKTENPYVMNQKK